ncbi:MAG: class I SAM-dependent methyltransferase [Candidatus Protistobacter heckmanni]|nr:class I SAM-dependent methyltransferase [Candidatus Protistobacter heckmanni]
MQTQFNEIKSCEVCGNDQLESVLNLGLHPMCDDLVEVGNSRVCREYPIEILFCKTCLTAHQRFQVPKHDLFPKTYHYRSRFTVDVLNGMASLAESCENRFGSLAGKTVLDVGCNDGSLLDFFRQRGALTCGIEPTGAAADASEKKHFVINDFLSPTVAEQIIESQGKPDFITLTNVFAHIENLCEVLTSLKILAGPKTVLVIENHYLGSVLATNQFDTFYHEHPRTYSYSSFEWMARSLGMGISEVEFPSRYGGNIRVFISPPDMRRDPENVQEIRDREAAFAERFATMSANIGRWRVRKSEELAELTSKYGALRAKAFPGRAAILVKLLGIDEKTISAVHEKPDSLKIGHYLPSTRIPIKSDEALFSYPDQTLPLLNLAWHIPKEIRSYMTEHGYKGQIVDILSTADFPAD